jgi:hypothetical protein
MGRINNRYKRDMKTAIQELIHFIENDRMQSIYTKEQILELLNFKLEKEKEQNDKAYEQGSKDAWDAFYEITQSE